MTGWLAPNGDIYSCNHMEHAKKAKELGLTENDLEMRGYVKLIGDSYIKGEYNTSHLTMAQVDALESLGMEI